MREPSEKYTAVYGRKWREDNPEACSVVSCRRERLPDRSLCAYHKETIYDQNVKIKLNRKVKVLTYYGPGHTLGCSWEGCNVTDIDMLSLDHVNNDGANDRRNGKGGSGDALYRQAEREGYPERFQTLCHNHQWKKEILHRKRK
jgi:hypothetical protein